MKSAREMFEELGYKLMRNTDEDILYRKIYKIKHKVDFIKYIVFLKENKSIACYSKDRYKIDFLAETINYKELQAINKQVEELGWNK